MFGPRRCAVGRRRFNDRFAPGIGILVPQFRDAHERTDLGLNDIEAEIALQARLLADLLGVHIQVPLLTLLERYAGRIAMRSDPAQVGPIIQRQALALEVLRGPRGYEGKHWRVQAAGRAAPAGA